MPVKPLFALNETIKFVRARNLGEIDVSDEKIYLQTSLPLVQADLADLLRVVQVWVIIEIEDPEVRLDALAKEVSSKQLVSFCCGIEAIPQHLRARAISTLASAIERAVAADEYADVHRLMLYLRDLKADPEVFRPFLDIPVTKVRADAVSTLTDVILRTGSAPDAIIARLQNLYHALNNVDVLLIQEASSLIAWTAVCLALANSKQAGEVLGSIKNQSTQKAAMNLYNWKAQYA